MAARISLKDQLAHLDQPAPIDLDPEDTLAGFDPSEHRSSIDHSAAREHYIDVAPSALRKQHESVSDPKYHAVPTSRKHLYDDDDSQHSDDEHDEDEGEDEQLSEPDSDHDSDSESAHEGIIGQDASGSSSEREQPQSRSPAPRNQVSEASATLSRIDLSGAAPSASPSGEPHPEGDIASNLRATHEADKKKGRAVSRQIALYDTLLDARIQLQKAVTAANRCPLPGDIDTYASHPDTREAIDNLLDVASSLTEELFSLQEDLLRLNESIEAPPRKRRKLEAISDPIREYGVTMQELSSSASSLEASYHPWLVDTLSKWSAKVQAVAPNVFLPDNRGSFMRDGRSSQTGVVSLIDDLLRSDGTKLLDRTRKRKDKHARIGHAPLPDSEDADGEDEEARLDVEVYDDTDYYQQLLRDVILARGGSDAQGGEQQWQIQQRERKAKRKKTVDTKASKGRKLRYEVHPKLQNFMVPVPVAEGDWHEEQIDGLFASLLQT